MESFTYPRREVQRKEMRYSPNLIDAISNAIDNRKVATLEYNSLAKGVTIRDVEPMAIVYKDRRRSLVAWCRLRKDFRAFPLDRLDCIKLRQEEFFRRVDLKLEDFQDDPTATYKEDDYDEEG